MTRKDVINIRQSVLYAWNVEKKTSGVIAAEFHITRNAVIGIVHRYGGEKRGLRNNRGEVPPAISKRGPRKIVYPRAIGLPIANQLSIPSHPRDIMSVTGCKWPIEDCDGAIGKYLFCNAPRDELRPYCEHHAAMAVATYSDKLIIHTIRQAIKP